MNIQELLKPISNLIQFKYVAAVTIFTLTLPAHAASYNVNCNYSNRTITETINRANEGDTINVFGTCVENVNVTKGVILDGRSRGSRSRSTATIRPADPSKPTIRVGARNVEINRFILEGSSESSQIYVNNNAFATIQSNAIANADRGIVVAGGSVGIIVGNHIQNNSNAIDVLEGSVVRVGFKDLFENVTDGNTIVENSNGISFARSTGYVVGNQILNNSSSGVIVARSSSVRVTGNEIAGNQFGIVNTSQANTDLTINLNSDALLGVPNFGVNTSGSVVCNSGSIADIVGPDFSPVLATQDCLNNTTIDAAP